MPRVILKGHIIVKDHELDTVKNALPAHTKLTQQESGCLAFQVTQDSSNKNCYTVYEEFDSKASFEAHQARVKNSGWGKLTVNVERHYEISECY